MPKAVTKPAPPTHDINDKVLCFHGPLLYEAKVLQIKTEDASKPPTYKVHYKGWKSRFNHFLMPSSSPYAAWFRRCMDWRILFFHKCSWDEWVPQDRVLKWSDENLKTQKRLKEEHAPPKKKMEKKKETRAPSEEAIAPPIRGQKRAREMDMDKVHSFCVSTSIQHEKNELYHLALLNADLSRHPTRKKTLSNVMKSNSLFQKTSSLVSSTTGNMLQRTVNSSISHGSPMLFKFSKSTKLLLHLGDHNHRMHMIRTSLTRLWLGWLCTLTNVWARYCCTDSKENSIPKLRRSLQTRRWARFMG